MCTVVLLVRAGHRWPLLLAGNRDEVVSRPWSAPARHWPDQPDVVGGLDRFAGGTWLALSDAGVVACLLNRAPAAMARTGVASRGRLVLEALRHATAEKAASTIAGADLDRYPPFNLIVGDRRGAFLVQHALPAKRLVSLPDGPSMISGSDLDDQSHVRIARHLPALRSAPPPDPDRADWTSWISILKRGPAERREDAMTIPCKEGYGTVSSAIIALPDGGARRRRPVFLFAAGPPDRAGHQPVPMGSPSVPQASPDVSNMAASSASAAGLPAQMTNWNAWK
jgi:hypothetical protein